ncbi:MAG: hypothetical protein QW735_02475 [archaeon]
MHFKEVLSLAKKNKEVEQILESGYHLNLAYCIRDRTKGLNDWILVYANQEKNLVIQFDYRLNSLSQPEKPIKMSEFSLDEKLIKTNPENMLEKAAKEFKKIGKKEVSLLVTLNAELGKPIWHFIFITSDFKIVVVKINAETGEIIKMEMENLLV